MAYYYYLLVLVNEPQRERDRQIASRLAQMARSDTKVTRSLSVAISTP